MNMDGEKVVQLLGVEGPSEFSAKLWFHGDLDGAASLFFTLCELQVGKLPRVFNNRETELSREGSRSGNSQPDGALNCVV